MDTSQISNSENLSISKVLEFEQKRRAASARFYAKNKIEINENRRLKRIENNPHGVRGRPKGAKDKSPRKRKRVSSSDSEGEPLTLPH